MTYDEIISALEKRGVIPNSIPSLIPFQKALKKSGLLSKINPKKNIVVAGTNGKGSICATLSALLTHAKVQVGLYTSPHLVTYTERFRIQDEDISQSEFIDAFHQLIPFIEEENLSHFESLTLMGAWIFFSGKTRSPVEYAIWEIGMGGLWDACNAIPHAFCSIASISIDHQFFLGNDLLSIARQKFGIIPPNGQVVFSPIDEGLKELREEFIQKLNFNFNELPPYSLNQLNLLKTPWGEIEMNLWGERAAQNSINALKTFELLGFDPASHLLALTHVRWPGRFSKEHWKNLSCPLYLSGDHNAKGIESLLDILKFFEWKNIHLIVGIGIDKDADLILEKLCSLPRHHLYLTETPLKPLDLNHYPKKFKEKAKLQDKSLRNILDQISHFSKIDDLVIITGSLYLVGHFFNLKAKSHL